jgi:hypothetical protein
MSFASPAAPHIIDIGSPGWCWTQLGQDGEGILSYESSQGRVNLAVPYAVVDRQIAISLASFNTAGWSAAGSSAQLEVSGVTGDDLRWVVRATGTGERSGQRGLAHSRRVHPSNPAGANLASPDRLILLAPRVRGFYETSITS